MSSSGAFGLSAEFLLVEPQKKGLGWAHIFAFHPECLHIAGNALEKGANFIFIRSTTNFITSTSTSLEVPPNWYF